MSTMRSYLSGLPSRGIQAVRENRSLPALLVLSAGMSLLLVWIACTRRLNFDESLALRAGWLQAHNIPALPPFDMPVTLFLGAAASVIPDPGVLFPVLRCLVVFTVLGAMIWAYSQAKVSRTCAALAVVATLSQAMFVTHAIEFRYDWAILVAWLLCFGLIVGQTRHRALFLGMCVALLAAHHLKGVFYGGWAYLFALAALWQERDGRGNRLAELHLGIGVMAGLWTGVSVLLGREQELAALYVTFADLASDGRKRVLPWAVLRRPLRLDAQWWLLVLVAVGVGLWQLKRQDRPASRLFLWSAAFALVPLAFLFAHPRPWPYLLAPPAPFLGLILALQLEALFARLPRLAPAVFLVLVLAVNPALTGKPLWRSYSRALKAGMNREVATLRLLREQAQPGDTALDPTGLAYFVPPPTPKWYIDTLFLGTRGTSRWLDDAAVDEMKRTTWVVNTYRLKMLPKGVRTYIDQHFTALGRSLLLTNGDPRLASARPKRKPALLDSYWYR